MRTRSSNPKRNIFAGDGGYETYNPEVEGFGSASNWRAEFNTRMGLDAAREKVGSKKPLGIIFGDTLPIAWTARTPSDQWSQIKSAWRKLVLKFHPDNNSGTGDREKFQLVQGAYEILEDEYRRKGVRV